MRFISKYGRYRVQVRPHIAEAYATGMSKTVQQPLYAEFAVGDLRPHERELAVASFVFNGFYQEQDEVTVVPPDYRIGVFDSEQKQAEHGWTDEERMEVETELERLISLSSDAMIVVPRSAIPPPWPRYDDFDGSAAELVRKVLEDGHSIEAVISYEKANQNRPDVLDELAIAEGLGDGLVDYDPDEETIRG